MAKQRRWMKWVLEEAETFNTIMPWERGYARTGWKTKLETLPLPRLFARTKRTG